MIKDQKFTRNENRLSKRSYRAFFLSQLAPLTTGVIVATSDVATATSDITAATSDVTAVTSDVTAATSDVTHKVKTGVKKSSVVTPD